MYLKEIKLGSFRTYKKSSFELNDGVVVIVGPNGIGKTNILEAINLLATGKSFRAEMEEEMIERDEEVGRVGGELIKDKSSLLLEVVLTRGEVGGQKVGRKKFTVNGVAKRMIDFSGNLKTVLFGPWDLDIVSGGPSLRRRFLDNVLSAVDREYERALLSYEKGVRQRNKLLERIRDEGISRLQLLFWDKLLIKNGDYIANKRDEFLNFLNIYQPLGEFEVRYSVEYLRSAISESRLAQYANEEVAAGVTLVGPHRDDFEIYLEGQILSKYGSRGEQRLSVLWLKMGELEYLASAMGNGERPLLLLDDIFSELDHKHRKWVAAIIGKQQTFLTTADEHLVGDAGNNAQVITLK